MDVILIFSGVTMGTRTPTPIRAGRWSRRNDEIGDKNLLVGSEDPVRPNNAFGLTKSSKIVDTRHVPGLYTKLIKVWYTCTAKMFKCCTVMLQIESLAEERLTSLSDCTTVTATTCRLSAVYRSKVRVFVLLWLWAVQQLKYNLCTTILSK